MCGRFGIDSNLPKQVEGDFNIPFYYDAESNIRPSMRLPTIIETNNGLEQFNGKWGIKPSWSNKLIINAQSETVSNKPTFKNSYKNYRCIIPMSYWYEWSNVNGKKIKHQFSLPHQAPLYMAGIFFPISDTDANIVSLTTIPNEQCKAYHHRMPLFVDINWIKFGAVNHFNKKIYNITQN